MEGLARFLIVLAPAVWTASAAAYLSVFVREDRAAETWARRLALTAVVLQLAASGTVGALGLPMVASPGGAIAFMGLAVAAVHLVLESRIGVRTIGFFPVAIAAGLSLAGASTDVLRRPETQLPAWSTGAHVLGAVLAYAGLLLAALYGALYLLQRRAMRRRRFGLLWERLPSLELLDQFSWRSLVAAAAFLTFSIAMGHVMGRSPGLAFEYSDPKIMFTNMIWLAAVLLALSRGFHWLRPARSAAGCLLLFASAVGNMLLVDLVSRVHRPH